MNRKWIACAGLGALMTLSVACGGGGSDGGKSTASTNADAQAPGASGENVKSRELGAACDLVSAASLSDIMGEAMKEGSAGGAQSQGKFSTDQCTWLASSTKSRALASVFYRKSTEKDTKAVFERTMKQFSDAVAVDGFDEGAYYVPSSGQLNVLAGDTWFIFTASHQGMENPDAVTEEHRKLAKMVLDA